LASHNGVTNTGFITKPFDEIFDDMESSVRSALNNESALYPDSVEGQLITIVSMATNEAWENLKLAYDGFNPNAVTGQALDSLVLLNGLTRQVEQPSSVVLSITGLDATVIPIGSQVQDPILEDIYETTTEAIITGGIALVNATAIIPGATITLASTVTDIITPINGWSTVTNNNDAIVGRLNETDAELRLRRSRSLSLAGNSSFDSVLAAVQSTTGVTFVNINENDTNTTNPDGVAPHTFEVVVDGGVDTQIAQAIWDKKPLGVATQGTSTEQVPDMLNNLHTINFSRPNGITIWLTADVTFLTGTIPTDSSDALAQAIVDFAEGRLIVGRNFSVAEDVILSELYQPFNFTYDDISVTNLVIGIDGVAYSAANIPIAFNELSTWDVTRIDITVG